MATPPTTDIPLKRDSAFRLQTIAQAQNVLNLAIRRALHAASGPDAGGWAAPALPGAALEHFS